MSSNRDAIEARVDRRTETDPTQTSEHADPSSAIGQISKPTANELDLISRSQQGDGDAFAQLYDRYLDRIYRYVFFRVSDDLLAEDITAQVFIKMWEKLPRYQVVQTPIGGWLYRIAHNAVIDYYRTRNVFVSLDDVNSAEVRHDDGLDQLHEALQKLTDGQRDVLILRFIEGLSVPEVARDLGKGQGAVRALQLRGLRELAQSPILQTGSQSYDQ